jgi:transposase-like protein
MTVTLCPLCNSKSKVVESRKFLDGGRRTRFECVQCQHRWTATTRDVLTPFVKEKLTPDQIATILQRKDLNHAQAGRLFNRTVNCIREIRHGIVYRDVCPEILRWKVSAPVTGPVCGQCVHWSEKEKGCDMEFPEARNKNSTFAKECNVFSERR